MRQTKAKTPDIDLSQLLQQVAREKNIDLPRWISALEDAIASAAKKQHRIKEPVRAKFDPETNRFEAFIVKRIVAEVEDPLAEWDLEEAHQHRPDANVGDEIHLPISTEGLGRIAAQSAKQVLYQRIREAEREKIYNEYIGRVGEIVNGTVKRFERGDIIVDLGRTEAAVPRSEQARHERYSQGERIRAVIVDVHTQPKGPQIVLSRTDPRLLVKLFEMEVPEIYDGTVLIKGAVRAPGERAKVAVASRERDVDPVGACVGMKGSRVQSIIRELRGEKIDIIEYSDDLVTFAQSALAPAKIVEPPRAVDSSATRRSPLQYLQERRRQAAAIILAACVAVFWFDSGSNSVNTNSGDGDSAQTDAAEEELMLDEFDAIEVTPKREPAEPAEVAAADPFPLTIPQMEADASQVMSQTHATRSIKMKHEFY